MSNILNLRNKIFKDFYSYSDWRKFLDTSKQAKVQTDLNETTENYKRISTLLKPDIFEGLNTMLGSRTIKGQYHVFKMLNFETISSLDKIKEYSAYISRISDLDKEFPLSEVEYEVVKEENYLSTEDADENEERRIVLFKESENIRGIIKSVYEDNSQLLQLGPRKFEELIAELLDSQGFKVELTKQTRDGGYDILAILPMRSQSDQKWLVECKRWSTERRVGVEIVRSFKEVVQSENVNKGIIVTTSYFTRDAERKRKETPYLLDFRDKNAVVEWVGEYMKNI